MAATKGGFQHYLRKEIAEQPQAWIDTLSRPRRPRAPRRSASSTNLLPAGGPQAIRRIVMVERGRVVDLFADRQVHDRGAVRDPGRSRLLAEFRYRRPAIDDRTLIIAVSQSGETADTLAAMEEGAAAAAICSRSPTRSTRRSRARPTRSSTRDAAPRSASPPPSAFSRRSRPSICSRSISRSAAGTAQRTRSEDLLAPAFAIPAQIETCSGASAQIEKIARKYGRARDFLYLGRGINYPVALEGALKLKEISYIHAEGYSAGEMKHGPIALIDENMPVVVLIPNDNVFEKTLSNLKEVESRNGRIIAVTDSTEPELDEVAWELIEVPRPIGCSCRC